MKIGSAYEIAGRPIGPDHPPYIIAEVSANHLGNLDRALELVDIAAACGCDAVKIQTYRADTITIDHDGPDFTLTEGLWRGRRLYELYQEAHTPWEWHEALFKRARENGVTIFSSPFDATAVELLERLETPAYKIASFEIVDIPLIELCASTKKPLIISTGMANLGEIEEAVNAAIRAGAAGVALLHCTSGYPTPFKDADLRTIPSLADAFGVPVGLSDHTDGLSSPVVAIALGASIIEKHITRLRSDGGPDAAFSLEPTEFTEMAKACNNAWSALGRVRYSRAISEDANAKIRRSLYVVADIKKGDRISNENVRSIRPGFGLPPKHLPTIIGKTVRHDLKRGTALAWSDIEN
ncbi:pseudaminic acid synthase [Tardiphaga alba]|uniref:Pseudaminic acid synthase n=1 Tax=Tardiphaga alba TaxID=340268 RepID=A0ABX8A623_9BRAD|nr:pseudaminic acid synthase [Tardiphaga alba]QUS39103.1 pseudaminic acid synthase [Tardiphaga alba]